MICQECGSIVVPIDVKQPKGAVVHRVHKPSKLEPTPREALILSELFSTLTKTIKEEYLSGSGGDEGRRDV